MEEVKRKRGRPRKTTPTPASTHKDTPSPPAPVANNTPGEVAPVDKHKYGQHLPCVTFTKDLEPGSTTKYLAHAMRKWNLAKIDLSDVDQVRERIEWYFQSCIDDDVRPNPTGLRIALGVSRQTISMWRQGLRSQRGEQAELVMQAYDMMDELWNSYMMDGKINPVAGIFLGKAVFGYKEEQNIVVTAKRDTDYEVDAETIAQKYAELPPIDED